MLPKLHICQKRLLIVYVLFCSKKSIQFLVKLYLLSSLNSDYKAPFRRETEGWDKKKKFHILTPPFLAFLGINKRTIPTFVLFSCATIRKRKKLLHTFPMLLIKIFLFQGFLLASFCMPLISDNALITMLIPLGRFCKVQKD